MIIQKSFQNEKGILYLVPTPIGNLEDITLRALRILKEADLIAAEDTRYTRKLLNHFEIHTGLISYHEHNKETSGKQIIGHLKEGKTIALVTDAGTPAISDPGYEIVQDAIKENIPVVALPGPNAALTALIASGLPPQPFYFYGFLSRKKKERDEELMKLKNISATLIFYEAPHRLLETVKALYSAFGNRKVVLGRELTKKFEEYIRSDLESIVKWIETEEIRGEFSIIVEGAKVDSKLEEDHWWLSLSVLEHVNRYVEEGLSPKEAIKQTAKDRGMNKRDVYQIYHIDTK